MQGALYPKRFYRLQARTQVPKAIILHSTLCTCTFPSIKMDTPKVQAPIVREANVVMDMHQDCIYHYILDMVNSDFEIFVQRPVTYLSPLSADNPIFDTAIHIALIGDYNQVKPKPRLYDVLAYRLLAPLLHQYSLQINKIYKHTDFTPKVNCPLKLLDMSYLRQRIQVFQISQ